ncbi:hypothetical protein SAMN02745194_03731 [Roseomonas rosea]|uniref:Glycosyl hydrolase family 65, N-terminal domain n=1 Tax=Muricoccus roseus TaxID=198092 RepID=A0A1M6N939_9PROT|nr:hypothetical protein [Roseomonas rosea]SHJ92157.1 hypothetical protein SAMN02745194_03731 [Roseomonas rosea]
MIPRREALLLGAGALMGLPAQAQPRAPAAALPTGVVLAQPLPCADRPESITGLLFEGLGAGEGGVVVLGQAFRMGDLPRGASLGARLPDARRIAAQADIMSRHPDGSARFAVVALALPMPGRGERIGVVLSREEGAAAPPLDAKAALAGRRATVTVTPAGGTPWVADLMEMLRAGMAAGLQPWQSGPLALQWRLARPVPPEVVGASSMRLVVDLSLRADGTMWADVWLRNDLAMRPGGGTADYALTVTLDGREALRSGPVRHGHYQAWGRLLGAGREGRPAAPPPALRPDTAYLAEAGVVARYDLSTGVEERFLDSLSRLRADPGWDAPLAPRSIVKSMGAGGGRPDLGPATAWQTAWLMTGDPRAAAFVLDQAEAAGAVPWHYWDAAGGADGKGGWMDERRWPRFWSDPRGGRPPLSLLQPIPRDTGWGEDPAHQPDLSYVPYLLTGRRAFLDNLQAQAAWNITSNWPANRYDRSWSGPINGLNIVKNRQVRSAAWGLRTLGAAAWISGDADPMAPYLREAVAANWAWMREQIPALNAMQGEAHGWWPPTSFGPRGDASPWQQDYLASAVASAARMGNADARAFLAWMTNFLVGRFEAEAKGFARHDGAAYTLAMVPAGVPGAAPYRSWAEIGEQTRLRGLSNGDGWRTSGGEYGRLALQSLAQISDVLDHAAARRVYGWLSEAGAPFTDAQSHARSPTLNIVPRGVVRVPARAPRCTTTRRG